MKKIEIHFHPELRNDKEGAGVAFDMFYTNLVERGYHISRVTNGPPGDRLLYVGENHVQMVMDEFSKSEEFDAEINNSMETTYSVWEIVGFKKKLKHYFGVDFDAAYSTAFGLVTSFPEKVIRVEETEFDEGLPKVVERRKYDVNPWHCSENQLPERGPERVFRGEC